MIRLIDWTTIEHIWGIHLWPHRTSPIKTHSSMCWPDGEIDMRNYDYPAHYLGYYCDDQLVGVNSGHGCVQDQYRSRGLWVDPRYRGRGIGIQLLLATIRCGRAHGSQMIWSYPRDSSWKTYRAAGFTLDTEWQTTENGSNAYCSLRY